MKFKKTLFISVILREASTKFSYPYRNFFKKEQQNVTKKAYQKNIQLAVTLYVTDSLYEIYYEVNELIENLTGDLSVKIERMNAKELDLVDKLDKIHSLNVKDVIKLLPLTNHASFLITLNQLLVESC